MNYKVENIGHNNTQISHGYLHLYIDGVEDIVVINVIEVTSTTDHVVYMELELSGESQEHKKQVLDLIQVDVGDNYRITDESLVKELFYIYGSSGG